MGAFLGKPPSLSYLPISSWLRSLTRKMIISFQCFSDKPKTEKYNESRVGGGLRYGLSSMQVLFKINFHFRLKRGKFYLFSSICSIFQTLNCFDVKGWRIEMEDAHSAVIGIPDQKENVSWFAGDLVFLVVFVLVFRGPLSVFFWQKISFFQCLTVMLEGGCQHTVVTIC